MGKGEAQTGSWQDNASVGWVSIDGATVDTNINLQREHGSKRQKENEKGESTSGSLLKYED